jgi:sialate O-acetylesterase
MGIMKRFILALIFLISFFKPAACQVRLPQLIRDSVVLQRDTKLKIWGWASPNEKIKIGFQNRNYRVTTDVKGKWMVVLPPEKAGGPYNMDIQASNHITIRNILIGDVWICSGQSNMVLPMERVKEKYGDDIKNADYPMIRLFFIPTVTDLINRRDDLPPGYWKTATPADVLQFSATAFFFARTIYEKYHIPIGLINASVGGTPIESWISEDGLKEFPDMTGTIQKNKDTANINATNRNAAVHNTAVYKLEDQRDPGLTDPVPWYDTAYIPRGWQNINIPGYWEDQGIKNLDGVVWYRKEIEVPATMTGIPARIFLGRIVDADYLYVNGKLVGNTTYQYPPRRYVLPAGLLKAGKNQLVVRVINYSGKGGFVTDKPYYLTAGTENLDLKGDWKYKVGESFIPHSETDLANGISLQNQPAALFNAMISPLVNFSIRGMIWYQGESSTGNAVMYNKLLPALIKDWRNQWQQGNVPFLFVQLPNFQDRQYLPSESEWAVLREAQLNSLSVPNTAMAVTIDIGEWNDIHPLNKKDVGIRLALAAQKMAYGENGVVYSGPLYQSSRIEGNRIIISFTQTGGGLITNDQQDLNQFAIAGADKKFVWAKAKIEKNSVVVWNDDVPHPVYVRYAWADNPEGANLFNREGLPASPFRTGGETP